MTSRARTDGTAARPTRRAPQGRVAWDKDRTRELFRRYHMIKLGLSVSWDC